MNWFFGDIIGNIDALGGLLTGKNRDIFDEIAAGNILDIGAADGDLAFFLETQNFRCDIIDYPQYNYNQMQAVYFLKDELNSQNGIYEVDLDEQFQLPGQYDAVFLLGTLYHLRNPFYVMEKLARSTKICFLSTRVTRWLQSGKWPWQKKTYIKDSSVAYLLGPEECNNDSTNYWIFSEAGLGMLVERTGWRVRDVVSYGDLKLSNPRDGNHDERSFMLLESTYI